MFSAFKLWPVLHFWPLMYTTDFFSIFSCHQIYNFFSHENCQNSFSHILGCRFLIKDIYFSDEWEKYVLLVIFKKSWLKFNWSFTRFRYEYDSDFHLHGTTDCNDESSSASEANEDDQIKLKSNLISPIKRNLPESDSSDSDSDIEL